MSMETAVIGSIGLFSFISFLVADKAYSIQEKIKNDDELEVKKSIYYAIFLTMISMTIISANFLLYLGNSLLIAGNAGSEYDSAVNLLDTLLTVTLYINIFLGVSLTIVGFIRLLTAMKNKSLESVSTYNG